MVVNFIKNMVACIAKKSNNNNHIYGGIEMLSQTEGLMLFGAYSTLILGLVFLVARSRRDSEDFLLMGRKLGVFNGSISMAVSWIWAPAVFIVSLQAYQQGLPGVFWFTVPNILTFFVFAIFAIKMRRMLPEGYAVSDIFKYRFPEDNSAHLASRVVVFGYQLGAIIINCVAGATLINLLSGIPYHFGVLFMAGLSLTYSLVSGLRASVITDVVQMLMILVIALIIVPWVVHASGGWSFVSTGLGGESGSFRNIADVNVAYSFGIATTLGLISGPVADQMFSQRAFAAKKSAIVPIFIFGGLIFGIVPVVLSILGFVGASASQAGLLQVSDPQMVGPEVVGYYLPKWALGLFAIMAFAGLTSTLDSALTAIGSLTASSDFPNSSSDASKLRRARVGMLIFAAIGVGIALLKPQLLWVFLIYGALASALFLPAFMALYWEKLTGNAAGTGIFAGFLIGTPLSVYANVNGNTNLIVAAALISLLLSGVVAWFMSNRTTKVS